MTTNATQLELEETEAVLRDTLGPIDLVKPLEAALLTLLEEVALELLQNASIVIKLSFVE